MNGGLDDLARLHAYDELTGRIWQDLRLRRSDTHDGTIVRDAAFAMARVWHRHPGEPAGPDTTLFWKRARRLLGQRHVRGWWVLDMAIREDLPRYEPPHHRGGPGTCEGPRVRPYRPKTRPADPNCIVHVPPGYTPPAEDKREHVCGAHATIKVLERDMATGWETARWFCRRHKERAAEVKTQLDARGTPPDPVPNRGGLLPCHFPDADWIHIYTSARDSWTPPYHGVCADDWPRPDTEPIPRRPRLALITSADAV